MSKTNYIDYDADKSNAIVENLLANFDANAEREKVKQTLAIFNKYVKGMDDVGKLMIYATIQGGVNGVLGEGLPGGGKTRSVEVIASVIGGRKFIVQGNPDLTPKDIMGSEWLDRADNSWRVSWSPMARANVVMGDEFNRLNSRCMSVFMSPMSEGRCTIAAPHSKGVDEDGNVAVSMHPVRVFLCVQNDVGSPDTNMVPPASYDRFLYMKNFTRISTDAERELLMDDSLGDREVLDRVADERVLELDNILAIRKWIRKNMRVHERFIAYQLAVVRATNPGTPEFKKLWQDHEEIRPILESIESGVSVRANMALKRACQVRAFVEGKGKDGVGTRNFVMPEDLRALAHNVFDHRYTMKNRAATRVKEGKVDPNADPFANEYGKNGVMTKKEIVDRLNRPGKNPILPSHVTDVMLAYLDHTQASDWAAVNN
jgi:MoxR-like ATPase